MCLSHNPSTFRAIHRGQFRAVPIAQRGRSLKSFAIDLLVEIHICSICHVNKTTAAFQLNGIKTSNTVHNKYKTLNESLFLLYHDVFGSFTSTREEPPSQASGYSWDIPSLSGMTLLRKHSLTWKPLLLIVLCCTILTTHWFHLSAIPLIFIHAL